MGLEVTFTAWIRGVHPDQFSTKLHELNAQIASIEKEMLVISARDPLEFIDRWDELFEELREAITLRALIWQAQLSEDAEVSG